MKPMEAFQKENMLHNKLVSWKDRCAAMENKMAACFSADQVG